MGILGWLNPLRYITDALTKAYAIRASAANDSARIEAEREIAFWENRAEVAKTSSADPWYSPRALMGFSVAAYVAKIIVWDTVLGLGVTQYPGEHVTLIVMTVIGFYFVSRGAETVSTIIATAIRGPKK